jgi:hypothetical protein
MRRLRLLLAGLLLGLLLMGAWSLPPVRAAMAGADALPAFSFPFSRQPLVR